MTQKIVYFNSYYGILKKQPGIWEPSEFKMNQLLIKYRLNIKNTSKYKHKKLLQC